MSDPTPLKARGKGERVDRPYVKLVLPEGTMLLEAGTFRAYTLGSAVEVEIPEDALATVEP